MSSFIRLVSPLVALFVPRVRSNLAADAGDRWRAERDWPMAAQCYRRAVTICPDRRPIWVQLGHALKESGDDHAALDAYLHAAALPGDDGDAPISLARHARGMGRMVEARRAAFQAVRERPEERDYRLEALAVLHDPRSIEHDARIAVEQQAAQERERVQAQGARSDMQVVFEVSDLISYFRHSRLPTGIQRVQIEVIRGALAAGIACEICCLENRSGDAHGSAWRRIPAALIEQLAALALAGRDELHADWVNLIAILTATRCFGDRIAFGRAAYLVNLGTSWWIADYFAQVRELQRRADVRYVPFVHDCIPWMVPQYCVAALVDDYSRWIREVFAHARLFLANSRATRADLQSVAAALGHRVDDDAITVIPLDGDFRHPGLVPAGVDLLAEHGLSPGTYVIYVATIEPRKNHLAAWRAWATLIARHGAARVPDLVCVGARGWNCDAVYAGLRDNPALGAKVRMVAQVSDAELARLYRDCAFAIYPSHYEGWGIPVTEALGFGKVTLVSDAPALAEAGRGFAIGCDVNDPAAFADALDHLIADRDARAERERAIAAGPPLRSWGAIAGQIVGALQADRMRGCGAVQ